MIYVAVLFGLVLVPLDLRSGPLGSSTESKDFLSALWQVVAAAGAER